jgi:hypothetical protein
MGIRIEDLREDITDDQAAKMCGSGVLSDWWSSVKETANDVRDTYDNLVGATDEIIDVLEDATGVAGSGCDTRRMPI